MHYTKTHVFLMSLPIGARGSHLFLLVAFICKCSRCRSVVLPLPAMPSTMQTIGFLRIVPGGRAGRAGAASSPVELSLSLLVLAVSIMAAMPLF
jgi:hypothetical protein